MKIGQLDPRIIGVIFGIIVIIYLVIPIFQDLQFRLSGEQRECKQKIAELEETKKSLSNCEDSIKRLNTENLDLKARQQQCETDRDIYVGKLDNCTNAHNKLLDHYDILINRISIKDYYIYIQNIKIHIIYALVFNFILGIFLTLNLIEISFNIKLKIRNIEISKELANYMLGGLLLIIIIFIVLSNVGLILYTIK